MLNEFYIGCPDGETESKRKEFEELFCDSYGKYEELINCPEKFIIIGRKGSGKTYLAQYTCKMLKKDCDFNCTVINAKDFVIEKLAYYCNEYNDGDITYALCKWFLLKQLAKYILDLHPIKSRIPLNRCYKLNKFFCNYEGKNCFKIIKKTTSNNSSRGNNLSLNMASNENIGLKSTEISSNKSKNTIIEEDRKEFFECLEMLEKLLLRTINKQDKIMMFLDDLDELDKRIVKNPSENDVILNLIKIAKNLNNKIGENIRIVLLVRTDVINKLQMYDTNLNKIKTSCGIELYWLSTKGRFPYEHPLMKMVLHKIKISCPRLETMSNKHLYKKLFHETINNKEALEYFLDHSFGRPRDIVTYLNRVIEEYPDHESFSAIAIKGALNKYSEDFYGELLNEAVFYEDPEYTEECFKLISRIQKNKFTYDDIKVIFESNKDIYKNIHDIDKAINFLYKTGALGNVWKIGNTYHYSWSYRNDSLDEVDLTKSFTIHYGLRKNFQCE